MPREVVRVGWGAARALVATAFGAALALSAAAIEPGGPLALEGVTYLASRASETQMRLGAERARFAPGERRVWLEGVELDVAAAPGVVGFRLSCQSGRLDLDSEIFEAQGAVRAWTQDGRELATESLRYAHASGVVSSDHPVRIRQDGAEIRGGGFRYDVTANRFVLRGGASVVQQP